MMKKEENSFAWNETIQKMTTNQLNSFNTMCVNKDLNEHKDTIIITIDSFRKMCDFIEQDENLGCSKCPIFNECFKENKHEHLHMLMEALEIERE